MPLTPMVTEASKYFWEERVRSRSWEQVRTLFLIGIAKEKKK